MKTISAFLFCFLFSIEIFAQPEYYHGRFKDLYSKTLSKDSVYNLIHTELDFIKINKGDTIADIGSADGYYPALYSIFTDSVSFYLNDIENKYFDHLDSIVDICSKIKNGKITNSFKIVIGNDSCTKLPKRFFNKIIIREAFHHFTYKEAMLDNIKKIMKPNSKLILYENIKITGVVNKDVCNKAMTKAALLSAIDKAGFKLIRELPLENQRCWLEFEIK